MTLNDSHLSQFISYLVDASNEDVYYQLKDWLPTIIEDPDEWEEALDYFSSNLNGSLQWVTSK